MEMNNLSIAFPAQNAVQSPSTLLIPGRNPELAESIAKRLALELRQPIALSWNIEGDDMLHLWVEKELKIELRSLNLSSIA